MNGGGICKFHAEKGMVFLNFSYLCAKSANILHLGIKKKRVPFVLRSIFRIFAIYNNKNKTF